jgi:glycerate kinase
VAGIAAEQLPVADGGEGTAEALAAALGGEWHAVEVADPLGRMVEARFVLLPGRRAVVESAEAIGLWRLGADERDPLVASSAGLGQLLIAAADAGATEILVTLGGSATVDGGEGMRHALAGRPIDGIRLRAACDVHNPLLGERGAARVFGPQKGASPSDVEELERRLAGMGALQPFAEVPGAGAAGGLGAALAALGAELVAGIELVLEAVAFEERLEGVALAITGEGRVDRTSSEGKVPAGVARACARRRVPCVVFGGTVEGGVQELYELGATSCFSLSGRPERTHEDLVELGESIGRLATALSLR